MRGFLSFSIKTLMRFYLESDILHFAGSNWVTPPNIRYFLLINLTVDIKPRIWDSKNSLALLVFDLKLWKINSTYKVWVIIPFKGWKNWFHCLDVGRFLFDCFSFFHWMRARPGHVRIVSQVLSGAIRTNGANWKEWGNNSENIFSSTQPSVCWIAPAVLREAAIGKKK